MDIDLDLDGMEDLQATFDDLEDRWGDANSVWKVGTDRDYGSILEFGRGPITAPEGSALKFEVDGETVFAKSVDGHPPYPWFKPAIREFKANPRDFIFDNTDYNSMDQFTSADELVTAVAVALENQMTNNVSANSASDRSPGTHPEHPQRDTGTLASSIQAVRVK